MRAADRLRRPCAAARLASPAAVGLLAVAIGAGLAGCTGSLFQSKAHPASTYLLSTDLREGAVPAPGPAPPGDTMPGAAPPVIAAALAVQRPRVRTGLDTDRIAVLYPDRRLDYFADARWSGPLEQVVQDLALQAFHTGAQLRDVTADSSAFPSGYWLEIEVADFQAEYESEGRPPSVHVRLIARLGAAGDRRVLGAFDADVHETAADNRLSAIVGSYERAAAAALRQIVADTSRVLAAAATDAKPVASVSR